MHTIPLIALLVLVFASLSLYFPLNRGHARYYLESPLDRMIPFCPAFILAYLALIPALLVGLFAVLLTPYAQALYLALIIGVLTGSFVRYFVHSGIRQPRIRRKDIYDRLVHWLYRHDDRAHTFPSSHVLIAVTMSYFLALAFPGFAIIIWALGICIAVSTLFVKQHYLVDVLGGAVFAILAIYLTGLIMPFVG